MLAPRIRSLLLQDRKRRCGKDLPQRLMFQGRKGRCGKDCRSVLAHISPERYQLSGSTNGTGTAPKTAMHPCVALPPQTVLLKGAVVLPPVAGTGTNAAVTVEPRPAPDQVAVECALRVVAPVNPMKMFWSSWKLLASSML